MKILIIVLFIIICSYIFVRVLQHYQKKSHRGVQEDFSTFASRVYLLTKDTEDDENKTYEELLKAASRAFSQQQRSVKISYKQVPKEALFPEWNQLKNEVRYRLKLSAFFEEGDAFFNIQAAGSVGISLQQTIQDLVTFTNPDFPTLYLFPNQSVVQPYMKYNLPRYDGQEHPILAELRKELIHESGLRIFTKNSIDELSQQFQSKYMFSLREAEGMVRYRPPTYETDLIQGLFVVKGEYETDKSSYNGPKEKWYFIYFSWNGLLPSVVTDVRNILSHSSYIDLKQTMQEFMMKRLTVVPREGDIIQARISKDDKTTDWVIISGGKKVPLTENDFKKMIGKDYRKVGIKLSPIYSSAIPVSPQPWTWEEKNVCGTLGIYNGGIDYMNEENPKLYFITDKTKVMYSGSKLDKATFEALPFIGEMGEFQYENLCKKTVGSNITCASMRGTQPLVKCANSSNVVSSFNYVGSEYVIPLEKGDFDWIARWSHKDDVNEERTYSMSECAMMNIVCTPGYASKYDVLNARLYSKKVENVFPTRDEMLTFEKERGPVSYYIGKVNNREVVVPNETYVLKDRMGQPHSYKAVKKAI